MPRPTNKDKIKALFSEYLAFIGDARPEIQQAGYDLIDTFTSHFATDMLKAHNETGGNISTSQKQGNYKIVILDEQTGERTQVNKLHSGFIIYTLLFLLQQENKAFNKENYEYVINKMFGDNEKDIKAGFEAIASTPLTHLTKKVLNSPTNLTSPRRGQLTTEKDPFIDKTTITYKGSTENIIFTIENYNQILKRQVRNGVKLFNFLLRQQNLQHGEKIDFMLSDLVNKGIYADEVSAYKGVKNILTKLDKIYVTGTYKRKGKEVAYKAGHIIMYHYTAIGKPCTVSLLPELREKAMFYTIVPEWAYTLSDNAFMLVDYIYYMARQSHDKITKDKSFNISFEAIRQCLGLPDPNKERKQTEKILKPIEEAFEEIEEAQRKAKIHNLDILPEYNINYKNVMEYLQGYLKITLDNDTTNYMIDREKDKIQALKKASRKKKKA